VTDSLPPGVRQERQQAQLLHVASQPLPASGEPMTSLSPACLLSFLMLMRYTLQYSSRTHPQLTHWSAACATSVAALWNFISTLCIMAMPATPSLVGGHLSLCKIESVNLLADWKQLLMSTGVQVTFLNTCGSNSKHTCQHRQ
jgi:hypothetical protein